MNSFVRNTALFWRPDPTVASSEAAVSRHHLIRGRRLELSNTSASKMEGGMSRVAAIFLFGLTAATMVSSAARCDDALKLAVGAPNNWDSGLPDIGKRAGIFKKHGLDLEILYTNGGGE